MPKFFCDYCDVYLTHDSMSVRKAHNSGRNHLRNVVEYYQQIGHEKAQSVIDSITNSYAAEGQSGSNPMLAQNQPGGFGIPSFPGAPGTAGPPPPGMPPGLPGFPPPGMPPLPAGFPPGFGPGGPGMGRGLPPMPPGFPPNLSAMPPGAAGSPPLTMPFVPPGMPPGFPPNFQPPRPGMSPAGLPGQGLPQMSPPPGVVAGQMPLGRAPGSS